MAKYFARTIGQNQRPSQRSHGGTRTTRGRRGTMAPIGVGQRTPMGPMGPVERHTTQRCQGGRTEMAQGADTKTQWDPKAYWTTERKAEHAAKMRKVFEDPEQRAKLQGRVVSQEE